MDLEIKIQEPKPRNFTIVPKGRIDSETYTLFEKQVEVIYEKRAFNVLLNMAGVNYISSAGLGAVFNMMKRLKESGGELLLCNLQPQIKKVFEIIKALPTTSIFASIQEADSHFSHIMEQEQDRNKGNKDQ